MALSDSARRNLVILVVAVIAVVASIPLFSSYIPTTEHHDAYFHLYRIFGIADALAKGDFPARMQYVQVYGYGYPLSICYGDLFLYLPAALVMLGVPVVRAYTLFAILVNAATAVIAYRCFQRIFGARSIGLVACALWTLAPYRLVNLYVRVAVGEYLAMTFLPMVVLGAFLVFTRRPGERTEYGWLWCAVGIACVMYSHMLTTGFVLGFCVVAVIIGLIFKHDRRTVMDVIKTVVCALLLSCAFWVPFLDFNATNELMMSPSSLLKNIERLDVRAMQPAQLLLLGAPMGGQVQTVSSGMAGEMAQNIGWAIWGGALIWVGAVAIGAVDKANRFRLTAAIALVVCSVLLMVLTTNLIPWDGLPAMGPFRFVTDFFVSLQFQFRLLCPISFMLICLGCMGLQDLRRRDIRVTNLLICALLGFALVEGGLSVTSVVEEADAIRFDFSLDEEYPEDSLAGVAAGEYYPKRLSIENIPAAASYGGVEEWSITEDGSRLIVNVDVGSEPGSVAVGRLFYAQYRVEPNADFEGTVALGNLAETVKLEFGAGSHGSVTVWFEVPVLWNVALGVTYVTIIGLIAYVIIVGRVCGMRSPRR